ncbi:DUF4291 domain-containing protein [Deinococcus sp. QL22]|uniref:DUF4291 domain-containing protein n=1 Tax=Deinococcus sp. QL22 TaxID=2939437 RepID=UPI0020182944|nr:DUF4291 domain-containing protein [Deinococcus sp. QL22]UQN08762.1 DUF4291 domain-containing protein [Deinococcus sp. QL22]
MPLQIAPYLEQRGRWPAQGRHILAQHDDDLVVVYQAYRPSIGHYAAQHGHFGGEYSFSRMSWIKPNFLWMMYRSGWGTKPDQEVTLALHLRRDGFETLLAQAVPSSYSPEHYVSIAAWKEALQASDVRLQWDPDHDPAGQRVARRAVQLGLRGHTLQLLNNEWLVAVTDISDFVTVQRQHIGTLEHLQIPLERPFQPKDERTAAWLGMDTAAAGGISSVQSATLD